MSQSCRRAVALFLIVGACATVARAEDPGEGEKQRLALTISFAGEPPVRISVPDGELASYRSFRYDESFGIVAHLDEETDEVEVQLVSLAGARPAYRPDRVLARLAGREGFEIVAATARAGLPVAITVERSAVAERAFGRTSNGSEALGTEEERCENRSPASRRIVAELMPRPGASGTCCVVCNGGEWCGCTVTTKCGHCTGC